ncbi:putative Rtr1/RPAP2 domain-containing protein [Septoria linicola]|nr:putative Rtr1/RPAP2 domain-containing protein [Septoria linicola]
MAAKAPVKSILKQPSTQKAPALTDEQKAKAENDRKNLNVALYHANRIQLRKSVEARILDNITLLIDYPASTNFSSKEAVSFVQLVKLFQPSDHDSLVEERTIDGRCGYALCSNPPRSQTMGKAAEWKLKKGMGDWCSNDCAKKGLFIKAQLSEVPAWERERAQQPEIALHEDDQLPEDDTTVRRANRAARVNEWREKVANEEELAAERGETTTGFRPKQVMTDAVIEKKTSSKPPRAPDADVEELLTGGSIEGFQPKMIGRDMFKQPGPSTNDR